MFLYITRHGKTLWNLESRFQGVKDSPLIESGIRDANDLNKLLINEHFDYVYTSPLGRAKQTCEIIFKNHDVDIICDSRLTEMNFGVFEGMKTDDIFSNYANLYDNLWNHPENFTRCPDGGESFQEVKIRIESFVNDLKKLEDDKKVFIVTHGMYFVCLLGYFLGYEPVDFPKINRSIVRGCSLSLVEIKDNQFDIKYIGKDDHLVKENKMTYIVKQKDVAK